MTWTAADFVCHAEALVAAFDSLSRRSPHTLHQWKLDQSERYCAGFPSGLRLHLKHPPVIRQKVSAATSIPRISVLFEAESALEDDSVEIYDPNKPSEGERKENGALEAFSETEWHFSVVYSETWQVPVLYFTVQQQPGGSPCSRTQVVEILADIHPCNREYIDDSWDFVSFEEHPITGIPSCFLHPCQTAARLHLLDFQSSDGDVVEQNKQVNPLLSWMCMILPSVGYGIPPQMYQELLSA